MDRFRRESPLTVKVATSEKLIENMTFPNAIYGTGWDGNVRMFINSGGSIEEIETE